MVLIRCERCLNDNDSFFYEGVCRRCLLFACDNEADYEIAGNVEPVLDLELTPFQKEISDQLCLGENDAFVEAVCGAGKTEICLELVRQALLARKKVGWAIPRRQVVLELAERLQDYFPDIRVTKVCQGYTDDIWGDLIVCTTHQLFRYTAVFDLLILDEPDAFPFAGNKFLQGMAKTSCSGRTIYLSATRDDFIDKLLEEARLDHFTLSIRPSYKALAVPKLRQGFFNKISLVLDIYHHRHDKCLIFAPTLKKARQLGRLLCCPVLTSQSKDKEKILSHFRAQEAGRLVATSILERGITFYDLVVMVTDADHHLLVLSTLIQMSGRVFRGMNPQKGACYFYCLEKTQAITGCITSLKQANHSVSFALKP